MKIKVTNLNQEIKKQYTQATNLERQNLALRRQIEHFERIFRYILAKQPDERIEIDEKTIQEHALDTRDIIVDGNEKKKTISVYIKQPEKSGLIADGKN